MLGGWGSFYGGVWTGFRVILCSGGNVTGSFTGVSLITMIGPWRMDASAYKYVPG